MEVAAELLDDSFALEYGFMAYVSVEDYQQFPVESHVFYHKPTGYQVFESGLN